MSEARAAPAPGSARQSILVIDDDPHMLRYLAQLLGSIGFHSVHQALSPAMSAQLWDAHQWEISWALIDLSLPDIPGDRLALRLLRAKPGLALTLMSANPPESLASVIPLRPGENYLQKPFGASDFRALLARQAPREVG